MVLYMYSVPTYPIPTLASSSRGKRLSFLSGYQQLKDAIQKDHLLPGGLGEFQPALINISPALGHLKESGKDLPHLQVVKVCSY